MKRLLVALACAAVAYATTASAQGDWGSPWRTQSLRWEMYGPGVAGSGTKTDTTFIDGSDTGIATYQDTTEAVSLADMHYGWAGQASTVSGCLRVNLESSNGISVDSIFVAIDVGASKAGPWIIGSFVGGVACTSGDDFMSVMMLCDDTNAAVTPSDKLLGAQWIRLRIRADGNTAAKIPGAKPSIAFPVWQN